MSRTRRLLVILALNLALVASLAAIGVTAHSLAAFAEGGDYILDAADRERLSDAFMPP